MRAFWTCFVLIGLLRGQADASPPAVPPVVGAWLVQGEGAGTRMEFRPDGSWTRTRGGPTATEASCGRWRLAGDQLALHEAGEPAPVAMTVRLAGPDALLLVDEEGLRLSLLRERGPAPLPPGWTLDASRGRAASADGRTVVEEFPASSVEQLLARGAVVERGLVPELARALGVAGAEATRATLEYGRGSARVRERVFCVMGPRGQGALVWSVALRAPPGRFRAALPAMARVAASLWCRRSGASPSLERVLAAPSP